MSVAPYKDAKELMARDARYKPVFTAMMKHRKRHDALIEIMHSVQDVFGYLPVEAMQFISLEMKVPPSKIYGVATFYHFFSLKPKGEHTCVVCTGTACHVKGAQGVINQVETHFKLKAGDTTADGKLGLQTVRCLGCCSLAPVVVLDEKVLANVTADDIVGKVRAQVGATV